MLDSVGRKAVQGDLGNVGVSGTLLGLVGLIIGTDNVDGILIKTIQSFWELIKLSRVDEHPPIRPELSNNSFTLGSSLIMNPSTLSPAFGTYNDHQGIIISSKNHSRQVDTSKNGRIILGPGNWLLHFGHIVCTTILNNGSSYDSIIYNLLKFLVLLSKFLQLSSKF
jgi:hypothetical protein